MGSRTIYLNDIGAVLLERSSRARRMSISVRPGTGARVALPAGFSYADGELFAYRRSSWIKKHLDRISSSLSTRKAVAPLSTSDGMSYLSERLELLSVRHRLPYRRLYIKSQRTIWGSCSSKNNINLNIALMGLPRDLIDYVIMHELVHTKIKNHGERFWSALDSYIGDSRVLDRRLKGYYIDK